MVPDTVKVRIEGVDLKLGLVFDMPGVGIGWAKVGKVCGVSWREERERGRGRGREREGEGERERERERGWGESRVREARCAAAPATEWRRPGR